MRKTEIMGLVLAVIFMAVAAIGSQAQAVTKIAPTEAEPGHPFTIIDTPDRRIVDGSVAVFRLNGIEVVLPLRTHNPYNTAQSRLASKMYGGVYTVFLRQPDGTEIEIGPFTVLAPSAPAPFIEPDLGPPGTAFTITDYLARIESGDLAAFYPEGTDPNATGVAASVSVSPDGTEMTGTVPACAAQGVQNFVSVRPPGGPSRFGDLAFFVTGLPQPPPSIVLEPFWQGRTAAAGDAFFEAPGFVTYRCWLNGVEIPSCAAPIHYSGLAHDSDLVVEVATTDLVSGCTGPVARATARVDALPPTIENLSVMQIPAQPPILEVSFTSSDSPTEGTIFYCDLDGYSFECAPGTASLIDGAIVSDGVHTVTVWAQDGLGNRSIPATTTAVFDKTGPMFDPLTEFVPDYPVCSNSTITTQIMFKAVDPSPPVTYECLLVFPDMSTRLSSCSPIDPTYPVFTWVDLRDGNYNLVVTARDAFLNATTLETITFVVASPCP